MRKKAKIIKYINGGIRMERKEIAIIGTGPAGISAAINAAIRHKSFYLFGNERLSDKVSKSEEIANVPGMGIVDGKTLNESLMNHMKQLNIEITPKRVTGIYDMGDYFTILCDQEMYEVESVLIAGGVESSRQVVNEQAFLGRGVSYCATCDGNLYKGKTIAVVCDNEEMEEEVEYLAKIVDKMYYYPLFAHSKFEDCERLKAPIKEIQGGFKVSKIILNNQEEKEVDGVFFLKASNTANVLLNGLEMNQGHVVVDREMKTNMKGVFAAGDCVGRPYQLAKAMGEGNIAMHSIFTYLNEKRKGK